MADQYFSLRNLKFLLHEVHNIQDVLDQEYFSDYDREAIDMMLDAAKQIGDQHIFPYFTEMDRQQAEYVDGGITVHPQLRTILQAMGEGGWISASTTFENGGMQLPRMLDSAAIFIFHAANNSVSGYYGLTAGAANLINTFGSEELKAAYVPTMYEGRWQGTMALTEPQAGSSLSDIVTSAEKVEGEDYYHIKGQKIFISGGDHDACDNVIHLMLARIKGAPAGTKGISLFVVPKTRLDGTPNDVTTAGIFHKMGQKSYSTAHLIMGENDNCRGYLVGEANHGLQYMFQMMNEARLSVGLSAAGTASAAYYASLQYAKERPQGRRWGNRDITLPQTLIIHHPDVRRMLFLQKAIVEGSISLLLECSKLVDLVQTEADSKKKEDMHLLLELLTPVAKTYPSEYGSISISNGLQVLGGYGYCTDFPLEQYYRDIRIMPIYEGTTGIQGLDILGRKVSMKGGKALMLLGKEIGNAIAKASQHKELQREAMKLKSALELLSNVTQDLSKYALKGEVERYLMDATLYLEMAGHLIIGWQWLKQGIIAAESLETAQGDEKLFFESKIHTMQFFFAYEIPKMEGLATRLKEDLPLTILDEEKELLM